MTSAAATPRRRYRSTGWGPFSTRTWRETGYLWVAVLLAPFALATPILAVALGAGLAVTVVGLFLAGTVVLLGRAWGRLYRGLGRGLLDVDVPAPVPWRRPRGRGFWAHLWAYVGDGAGWRGLAFCFLSFIVSVTSFVVSVSVLAYGLGAITYGYWYQFLPWQTASDGTRHRGAQIAPDWFVDTPARIWGLAAVGVVMLLVVWSPLTRGMVHLSRLLTTSLLGPTRASLRVAALEQSRGRAVEDAEARLRRIERDLHDGTQARLVAVAMQLGEAKEQLATGQEALVSRGGDLAPADATVTAVVPGLDLAGPLALVTTAHTGVKEALVELRELARGIHPPALEAGLPVALETLAARSPLPCTIDVDPDAQAAPAIEAIAYFCVAELLTNAVKHSGATGLYVLVTREVDAAGQAALRLRVRDDGHGGARVVDPTGDGRRTGLAGLVERVGSVDGSWELSSPVGGPTVVTIVLPVDVTHA